NIEAEALGQRLNWESNRMPDIDRPNPLLREHSHLDHLRPPDFQKTGRMPFVLEVMRRCYDLGLPVRIRFCSPFSLAVNIRGIENLLIDILTAPQFAHRLLTFLTDEVLIPWVQAQREAIGQPYGPANGADAAASPPIVTVEILDEFVMPYILRMNQKIGKVTGMGYWGYSYLFKNPVKFKKMLELMALVNPKTLNCLDPDVARTGPEPYAEFARQKKMSLRLGLDTLLLQEGSLAEIAGRCRRYVMAGSQAEGLVISLNDVSIHTPPRNVHTAIAAVRHFGKLPIEDRPQESFQPPEVESFGDFLKNCRDPVFLGGRGRVA
ncbi:MAG: uroporphyrinogen decarboxylase family protein, partial [Deltaproteobacteria bacterium]|nr:uroporphyrinogen decarboxylase family protein [Deltaproteobacteria bacterium]